VLPCPAPHVPDVATFLLPLAAAADDKTVRSVKVLSMNEDPESDTSHAPLEGRYANCFNSGFNAFEFVFEFGQYFPGAGDAHWHTRVITSPPYAKALFETIRQSLTNYENSYGSIPPVDDSDSDG
jgi:Protein of unknown function (DUF3467)